MFVLFVVNQLKRLCILQKHIKIRNFRIFLLLVDISTNVGIIVDISTNGGAKWKELDGLFII